MRKNILIQKTIFACIAILFSFAQVKAQTTLFPPTLVSDIGTGNIGAANTSRNVAVDAAGNIGVVWVGTAGLRFAKSVDRGHTFMPSVQLSTATSGNCEVEVADNGNIYVVYSNGSQIQLFVSLNSGASFTGPNTIGNGSAPHIASFGSNVYIVPQSGNPVYRNANNGVGAFSSVSMGSWVFADIRVDKANGDVYLIADNPTIYMYRSTNAGVSFTPLPVSASVYYSSYTITTGPLGKFIYVAGGNGNTGYRIDFTTGASTTFSAGVNAVSQGRTLTSDEFGNFVDGYAATTNTMAIRVSNDKAATFGSPITIPSAVTHNVARNSATQDVVIVYQGTDGKIYLNVYDKLLKGLTTSNVNAFYCPGSTGTVSYSAIGTTFNAGNQFIVQLSDRNRSFANPVTIGTVSSTATSGTVNFTIPDTISSGTQYRIRVISTNIATTGADNLFDISINPTPVAQVTASGATTICQGSPVVLASSTGSSYLWSNGATTSSISVNTPGTYSVTVGNGCGLFATSSPVTVNVTLQPTITASGPTSFCTASSVKLTSSAGTSYLWSNGATSQSITVSSSGSYTVKVTGGGCSITSQPVQVTDHDIEKPATPVLPDLTGECSVTVPIATTTDNCAGIVNGTTTDPLTYATPGTYSILWTFADGNGNSTTATQKVTVTDVTPPSINCHADITVPATSAQGAVVSYPEPKATDNCSVPVVARIAGPASGSLFPIGTTTISYQATDAVGLTTTCTFNITVSGLPPVIACPDNIRVPAATGSCKTAVNFAASETTAVPASVIGYTENGNPVQPGSEFTVGVHTITATATNPVGTSVCSFIITVTDDEKPAITAPAALTVNTDPGKCGSVVNLGEAATSDNCGVASVTNDAPASFPVGTTIVTWTVTDIHGNVNTATQSVTVTDNEKPAITAPAALTVNTDPGKCGSVVNPGEAATSDNCGVASVTNDAPASFPVGTTIVTWTVTDIHGNVNTATQSVTVTDNESPIVKTRSVTVTLVNGIASVTAAMVNDGSSDNCGIASVTLNGSAVFHCSDIGNRVVTLVVTDIHGNTQRADAVITVTGEIPGCSIKSAPTSNVYTGGNPNNLYLGYGAQSTVLQVIPVGASGNGGPNYTYTYSWSGPVNLLSSTTSGAPVFTPTAAGFYSFTVVTTNNYGCSTSCSISICVTDIRVPGTNGAKVYVCHMPPGNNNNPQTLSISVNAVPSHLSNHAGDRLGSCDQKPCANLSTGANAVTANTSSLTEDTNTSGTLSVQVLPNPSTAYFTLRLSSKTETPVNIVVTDVTGRRIDSKPNVGANSTIQIGHNYISGKYFAELIQGSTRKTIQLIKLN